MHLDLDPKIFRFHGIVTGMGCNNETVEKSTARWVDVTPLVKDGHDFKRFNHAFAPALGPKSFLPGVPKEGSDMRFQESGKAPVKFDKFSHAFGLREYEQNQTIKMNRLPQMNDIVEIFFTVGRYKSGQYYNGTFNLVNIVLLAIQDQDLTDGHFDTPSSKTNDTHTEDGEDVGEDL
ncbi:hypothetical protein HDU98_000289 [Podochytrium sp. JEL0797]|nr:hypothetical protein HDU98_000289 [Podochytrium sp. JEL0797]